MFRGAASSVFVAAFAIIAWRARGRREKFPLARLLAVAPLVLGTVASLVFPRCMAWAFFDLSPAIRWAGLAVGALAVVGVHWVFTTFGEQAGGAAAAGPPRLVTHGPYRWVRHPMYLVMIVLFLSLGVMISNGFILSYTVALLLALRLFAVPREDARLAARFGDEYERYRSRTGAFVPIVLTKGRPRHGKQPADPPPSPACTSGDDPRSGEA